MLLLYVLFNRHFAEHMVYIFCYTMKKQYEQRRHVLLVEVAATVTQRRGC